MTTTSSVSRAPRPSSLADVLDLILDKGLVVDAYVRVSVVGIELLTVDARIVVASVDTYLRYAEAVNRLDLPVTETRGLPEILSGEDDRSASSSNGQHRDRSSGDDHSSGKGLSVRAELGQRGRESHRDSAHRDEGDDDGLVARVVERGRVS